MNQELFQALREMMGFTWIIVLCVYRKKFKYQVFFVLLLILGFLFMSDFSFVPFFQRFDTPQEAYNDYLARLESEDRVAAERAIIGSDIAVFCNEVDSFTAVNNSLPYYNNGRGWKSASLFARTNKMYTTSDYCIVHNITVPKSNECIVIIANRSEWLLKHPEFDVHRSQFKHTLDTFEVSDTIGTEFEPLFFDENGQANSYYAIITKSEMQDYKIIINGFEVAVESKI